MKYQIQTYGGETILLTDEQYRSVVQAYDAKIEELRIGEQRIPRKAISFIGFTPGASEEMRVEEHEYLKTLSSAESKQLQEARFNRAVEAKKDRSTIMIETVKERVWKGIGGQRIPVLIEHQEDLSRRMTDEEEQRGDAMYWTDSDGIKHYD